MPFLAAIPGLLASAGVGGSIMGTLATVLPAVSGAAQLASGIVQGDPGAAISGAVSGALGGLGGAGAFGSAGGSAPQALGSAAGQSVGAAAQQAPSLVASAPTIASAAPAVEAASQMPDLSAALNAPAIPQAELVSAMHANNFLDPVAKGMSIGEKVGLGLQGAGAATQGVLSILSALKKPDTGTTRWGLGGGINTNLPAMSGTNTGNLPQVPKMQIPGAGELPTLRMPELQDNALLYQLLGAFRA